MTAIISYHKNNNANELTLSKKIYFDCEEFDPQYLVKYIKDILTNEATELKIKVV